jgi:hypothetical protein
MRSIPEYVPKIIYKEPDEKFIDIKTGNWIAVKKIKIKNVEKEMMIAYNETIDEIKIITIHPLKSGQKENRVSSGRWIKL